VVVVRSFLQTHLGWHDRAVILEAAGVVASEWKAAIKELLEPKRVERQRGEEGGAA